jgi:hypothetical protein
VFHTKVAKGAKKTKSMSAFGWIGGLRWFRRRGRDPVAHDARHALAQVKQDALPASWSQQMPGTVNACPTHSLLPGAF